MNLYFLFFLVVLTSKGIALQELRAACSNGVEISFPLVLVETTSIPRYRLERRFRNNDRNCIGTIEIIGQNGGEFGGDQPQLIELGSDAFQKLPLVDEINLSNNVFSRSNRDMYIGSPNIEIMSFRRNYFSKLDANTQFPLGIKSLDFSRQVSLSEVKSSFFANHESLTELDISGVDAAEIAFEKGIFQTAIALEKLVMGSMPVLKLEKSLLSNHAMSLKHIDMSRWKKLTSVEYNAFFGTSLEELDLSEWPLLSLDADLFSGASITKLILHRAKITTVQSGCFAGLRNSQEIDLYGSKLTSIESGSFRDYVPLDNFKLTIPKDISCCKLDGLVELINISNGISINDNLQNYTCITPDKTEKVINILLNENPSLGLSCCDYQKEYYDRQKKSCEECKLQSFCSDNSDSCKGEETNFLTCNKCNSGYAANPFECQECKQSPDCDESFDECSTSSGNEIYLKCNKCAAGLAPEPSSGICKRCLELSPTCVTYDTSCVIDTQKLACKICDDDTQLIEGNCVTVDDSSLPMGAIIGISIGSIIMIALVSVIVLRVCLRRRKNRKEKELLNSCGIYKNESGVELHPIEYQEPGDSSDNALFGPEHLQAPDREIVGSDIVYECIDYHIQLEKSDLHDEKPEEYVQLGTQNNNINSKEEENNNINSKEVQNVLEGLDPKHILLEMPSECRDDKETINNLDKNRTNERENQDDNAANAAEYIELGVQKELADERMNGNAPTGSKGATPRDQYWDPCHSKNSTTRSSVVDGNYWDPSQHENEFINKID